MGFSSVARPAVDQTDLDAAKAKAIGTCIHNGTAYPTRPSGYAFVMFVGPTDPRPSGLNIAVVGDLWLNTA